MLAAGESSCARRWFESGWAVKDERAGRCGRFEKFGNVPSNTSLVGVREGDAVEENTCHDDVIAVHEGEFFTSAGGCTAYRRTEDALAKERWQAFMRSGIGSNP